MRIIATKIKAKNLKAGDLFSTASQTYWNQHRNNRSIGEKVYIRTEEPSPKNQENVEIYKLDIEK